MPLNPQRTDPTRTFTIRRGFRAEGRKRLKTLSSALWDVVVVRDSFGLGGGQGVFFGTADRQIEQWRGWLETALRSTLLGNGTTKSGLPSGSPWFDRFTLDGFKRGVRRAYEQVRGGAEGREAFVQGEMQKATTREKVAVLNGVVRDRFDSLATFAVTQTTTALANSLGTGVSPEDLGRLLTDSLQAVAVRAELLTESSTVRAHADGQLVAFSDLGEVEVGVYLETARDGKVCEQCSVLDGKFFTVADAAGVIPVHVRCRCVFTPGTKASK